MSRTTVDVEYFQTGDGSNNINNQLLELDEDILFADAISLLGYGVYGMALTGSIPTKPYLLLQISFDNKHKPVTHNNVNADNIMLPLNANPTLVEYNNPRLIRADLPLLSKHRRIKISVLNSDLSLATLTGLYLRFRLGRNSQVIHFNQNNEPAVITMNRVD